MKNPDLVGKDAKGEGPGRYIRSRCTITKKFK